MSADDIASNEFQLEQVEQMLTKDPDNEDLLRIKSDLQDLISLQRSMLDISSANNNAAKRSNSSASLDASEPSAPAKPKKLWNINDVVACKWSDGKWYEATVTAVSKKKDTDPVYSVVFKGYTTVQLVKSNEIREFDPDLVVQVKKKRTLPTDEANQNRKSKKNFLAKKQKLAAKIEEQEKVQQNTQQAWLNFAGGKGKKKMGASSIKPVPILKKKSMFATPDNPEGKVGVVGSGKGMTQFGNRGKHQFDTSNADED
ncbi:hypothetical protein BKA69DRAFT_1044560 [Paraphysoderma sedebokerense]|nr:hypothetical protein BKA69DRAFT_1044560 [Paraphysoderma sedebokerense]